MLPAASTAVTDTLSVEALVAAERAADALDRLRLRAEADGRRGGRRGATCGRARASSRRGGRWIVTRQVSLAVSTICGLARRPTRPLRATRMPTRGDGAVGSGRTTAAPPRAPNGGSAGGTGLSTQAPGAPSWIRSTLPRSIDTT